MNPLCFQFTFLASISQLVWTMSYLRLQTLPQASEYPFVLARACSQQLKRARWLLVFLYIVLYCLPPVFPTQHPNPRCCGCYFWVEASAFQEDPFFRPQWYFFTYLYWRIKQRGVRSCRSKHKFINLCILPWSTWLVNKSTFSSTLRTLTYSPCFLI